MRNHEYRVNEKASFDISYLLIASANYSNPLPGNIPDNCLQRRTLPLHWHRLDNLPHAFRQLDVVRSGETVHVQKQINERVDGGDEVLPANVRKVAKGAERGAGDLGGKGGFL